MSFSDRFSIFYGAVSLTAATVATRAMAGDIPTDHPLRMVVDAFKTEKPKSRDMKLALVASSGIISVATISGYQTRTYLNGIHNLADASLKFVLETSLIPSAFYLSMWMVHQFNTMDMQWKAPEEKMLGDQGLDATKQFLLGAVFSYLFYVLGFRLLDR